MVVVNWLGRLTSDLYKLAKRGGWGEAGLADAPTVEQLFPPGGD